MPGGRKVGREKAREYFEAHSSDDFIIAGRVRAVESRRGVQVLCMHMFLSARQCSRERPERHDARTGRSCDDGTDDCGGSTPSPWDDVALGCRRPGMTMASSSRADAGCSQPAAPRAGAGCAGVGPPQYLRSSPGPGLAAVASGRRRCRPPGRRVASADY